jgi:hypothetical protein
MYGLFGKNIPLKSIYRSSTKLYMIGENSHVYKQWAGLPGKNASIGTSA